MYAFFFPLKSNSVFDTSFLGMVLYLPGAMAGIIHINLVIEEQAELLYEILLDQVFHFGKPKFVSTTGPTSFPTFGTPNLPYV